MNTSPPVRRPYTYIHHLSAAAKASSPSTVAAAVTTAKVSAFGHTPIYLNFQRSTSSRTPNQLPPTCHLSFPRPYKSGLPLASLPPRRPTGATFAQSLFARDRLRRDPINSTALPSPTWVSARGSATRELPRTNTRCSSDCPIPRTEACRIWPSVLDAIYFIKKARDDVSSDTIKNCLKKTGFREVNDEKVINLILKIIWIQKTAIQIMFCAIIFKTIAKIAMMKNMKQKFLKLMIMRKE
ncbi:hypothetical protein QE152_g6713 [Popillia japonica]|uniref:Uncharacterized protein n=1 Tax=Popillia japonica TaxID=7064 RepID=A0AAW1MHK8_POPJA